jgi:predicted nuclease with TOPRIM domain
MKRPSAIATELKNTSIALQEYVTQLEKENLKLHKTVGKVQAKYVSGQNKVAALEKSRTKFNISINFDEHQKEKELHKTPKEKNK